MAARHCRIGLLDDGTFVVQDLSNASVPTPRRHRIGHEWPLDTSRAPDQSSIVVTANYIATVTLPTTGMARWASPAISYL